MIYKNHVDKKKANILNILVTKSFSIVTLFDGVSQSASLTTRDMHIAMLAAAIQEM